MINRSEITEIPEIGNYRGSLYVMRNGGYYFWAVECDFDPIEKWDWGMIPESLYNELINYHPEDEYGT